MTSDLDALATEYFHAAMDASPLTATVSGVQGYDAQLPDLSEQHEADVAAHFADIAARAAALDPAPLDDERQVTRDMLQFECAVGIASITSRALEYTAGGMRSPLATVFSFVPKVVLTNQAQADDYVIRCRAIANYLDQAAQRLEVGTRHDRRATRRNVQQALQQIDAYLAGAVANDVLLTATPDPALKSTAWREEVSTVIETQIRSAVARLREVVVQTVAPAARPDEESGLCYLPDGDAFYAAALRVHTSTDLDADAIHELGLKLCAELREEFSELGAAILGTSEFDVIAARLRTDPTLRYDTSEDILADARAATERAITALPAWFRHIPEAPCIVEPMNALEAPDAVIGYYQPPAADGSRPGRHWVNTTNPTQRGRYEYEALAFHESIPGHHLQIASAQELDTLPDFRRFANVSAFVEGWGLYCERLADEMGLYSSGVARLGMLSFDAWRACRLVVDTGIHAFGWSREKAIEFMTTNSALAEAGIANEVDPYIAFPGQATAYMVGRVELHRLRDRVRARRDHGYDPRDFHQLVLGSGAIPLSALTAKVDRWLGQAGGDR